jgi:outer membrane protein assembly factor BamB
MKQINKSKVFFLLVIFLLTALVSSCSRGGDWVQFRGEGGRGVSSSNIAPPLGLRWKIKLQDIDKTIESFNPPVVMGDTIYFGANDGNFYALDVESGYMRWVFKSGGSINSIPYADKDRVYFGSQDRKLYALSRETGEEIWNYRTRSQVNSQVQRYGDYIVFVSDSDAIYFLNLDGEEIFNIYNPGWIHYTFLIEDDIFYFGTGPVISQVGPYDINKREFLWWLPYYELEAQWYSAAAIDGSFLYMGTADVYNGTYLGFHAYNRHTGERVWSNFYDGILPFESFEREYRFFRRNVEILDYMAPTVWRDLVIFTGGDNVARAFDAKTGVLKWEREFSTLTCSAPTTASGRIYFGLLGEEDNIPPRLVCLSARDGRLLWEMETEGAILSAPVIAGKRIIFGTDANIFYVLEQVF